MPSNGFQPGGQGIPAFPNSDGFDLGGDSEELARYAAFRGNTLRGTEAEMLAFPHPADGLWWSNTTDGGLYRYTGTAWVQRMSAVTTTGVTLGTGWTATTGAQHAPRLMVVGRAVNLYASLTSGAGFNYASMLTVPVGFRPASPATRFVGAGVTSGGVAFQLALTNGVLSVPTGYAGASISQGQAHPIVASWPLD